MSAPIPKDDGPASSPEGTGPAFPTYQLAECVCAAARGVVDFLF